MENDKIKKGLSHCVPFAECADCPYLHPIKGVCYEALHNDALLKIDEQERTIAILKGMYNHCLNKLQMAIDLLSDKNREVEDG